MEQVPVIANDCCGVVHSGHSPAVLGAAILAVVIGAVLLGLLARRGKLWLGGLTYGVVGLASLALLWMWFAIEPITLRYTLWFVGAFASPFEALWLVGGVVALAASKWLPNKRPRPELEAR